MESIPVRIKTKEFETNFFQLDLILTSKENFDNYLRYLSFNDLGQLIGRVAFSQGLRYGGEGLYYNFPYEHHFTKTLGKTKLFLSNRTVKPSPLGLGYKVQNKKVKKHLTELNYVDIKFNHSLLIFHLI